MAARPGDIGTMSTLADVLNPQSPSDPAVLLPDAIALDYGELDERVQRVAGVLAGSGVKPGEPVSIVLTNGLEFLVTFLAVVRAGAVAAPLNPAYTRDEFTFYMEDAGSRLALVPPEEHAGRDAAQALGIPVMEVSVDGSGVVQLSRQGSPLTAVADPVPPSPGDVALFLHTSGTTSRPKGVPLTHANIVASLENIGRTYELAPDDVAMVVMPLFHVHGLIGVALSTLSTGGSIVVPPRFSAGSFWPVQQAAGVTWYSAVPTIHQILLARADDDAAPRQGLRLIRSCSSALAPAVFHQLESRFGAPVLEAYGMTEASHQMASHPLPPGERLPGTVGTGTGVEIGIMDESGGIVPTGERAEVVIKGPNVTHGYRNNPEANADAFVDGWFRTGDQGQLSESGSLTLTGRIKELINRGGEKISPLEVDAALLLHPCVAEAVSFGVPDAKYGEAVQAAVVLRDDADQEAIRAFCGERLASFKVPDRIYVATELPRTATGKIQRRHIAAAFAQQG